MNKKKVLYITLFTFLGIGVSTIVHATLEMYYIARLIVDFDAWNFGFSWEQLRVLHNFFGATLFAGGAVFGFVEGEYWWRALYEPTYAMRIKHFVRKVLRR